MSSSIEITDDIRRHNAAHPHHHVINEGLNTLPGSDGVDQLEMEKEMHDEKGMQKQYSPQVAEVMPSYSSTEKDSVVEEERESRSHWSMFYARYRIYFHILIGAFFTAWWLVGITQHRDLGWIKPFLVSIQHVVCYTTTNPT